MKKSVSMIATLLTASACQSGPRASSHERNPASSAPPIEQYEAEGFQPDEINRYLALNARLGEALGRIESVDHSSPRRGFHYKVHGCVKGTLTVQPTHNFAYGIFANAGTNFPIWARFSNGMPFKLPDALPDFRGLAIKVLNTPGDQLLADRRAGGIQTQDFVLINSPSIVLQTPEEAVTLLEAFGNVEHPELIHSVIDFFEQLDSKVVKEGLSSLRSNPALATPVSSTLSQPYWSTSAISMGPKGKDGSKSVNLKAESCDPIKKKRPNIADPEYLTKDLSSRMLSGATFCLYALSGNGPNSGKELIAKIEFKAQDITSDQRKGYCENLGFSPWHGIKDHEPLGDMMRYRRFGYDLGQTRRGAISDDQAVKEYNDIP